MPPKVEAGGGASATTAGHSQKRKDSQFLQAFLLSQSSLISKEKRSPGALLAETQEKVLNEQGWTNFSFLREVALFNTTLLGRPNMTGDTERLFSVVKSQFLDLFNILYDHANIPSV